MQRKARKRGSVVFKNECEALAAMANEHTIEGCATGWLDNRPVKNAKAIDITKRLKVFTEEVKDIEAVPYLLADRIRSYQRAIVNPLIDGFRLSAIANAASICNASVMYVDYVVPALSEQLEEIHKRIGDKQLAVFINSRLWTRVLKSKYIRLFENSFFTQGQTTISCKKLDGDILLPVRHQEMMSAYENDCSGLIPAADAVLYNWIICPCGLVTGNTTTQLALVEPPVAEALDEKAWTFNYTKTIKLWNSEQQATGIAVHVSK